MLMAGVSWGFGWKENNKEKDRYKIERERWNRKKERQQRRKNHQRFVCVLQISCSFSFVFCLSVCYFTFYFNSLFPMGRYQPWIIKPRPPKKNTNTKCFLSWFFFSEVGSRLIARENSAAAVKQIKKRKKKRKTKNWRFSVSFSFIFFFIGFTAAGRPQPRTQDLLCSATLGCEPGQKLVGNSR